jgi:hypothetical protein
MFISVYNMDQTMQTGLIIKTEVDALSLIIVAESREDEARNRGRAWTAGVVPFNAQELMSAAKMKKSIKEIERYAFSAAMAAWLCDSIYDGVPAEEFTQSDVVFTLLPDGAVKYDRVPATNV